MNKAFLIAIDGPPASGKGTVSHLLSQKFNGLFMSSGSMYRALALLCIENGLDTNDEKQVETVLSKVNVEYSGEKVLLNGKDVTQRLTKEDVSRGSSEVAIFPRVREELSSKQKELITKEINKGRIVVMDGQDIAVLFPFAKLKIFLTAIIEIRAKRRQKQYQKQGIERTLESVIDELTIRDNRDRTRKIRPLSKDPIKDGYFLVDNSLLNEKETSDIIEKQITDLGLYDKN